MKPETLNLLLQAIQTPVISLITPTKILAGCTAAAVSCGLTIDAWLFVVDLIQYRDLNWQDQVLFGKVQKYIAAINDLRLQINLNVDRINLMRMRPYGLITPSDTHLIGQISVLDMQERIHFDHINALEDQRTRLFDQGRTLQEGTEKNTSLMKKVLKYSAIGGLAVGGLCLLGRFCFGLPLTA